MANYTFDSDAQGWTGGSGTWTGAEGHGVGCMVGEAAISGLSIAIDAADPVSFWYKIVIPESGSPGEVLISLLFSGTGGAEIDRSITVSSVPYDSGWVKVNDVGGNTGTITGLAFDITLPGSGVGTIYFDSIYVAEAEPGGAGFTRSAGGIPGGVMV